MYTYLSLGTPHLGCIANTSFLVKTGMKQQQKFKRHESLNQMSLDDTSDYIDSYIYKLSYTEGLDWFQHIIQTSSYQDFYSPFHSSRIEYGDQSKTDKKGAFIITKMVENQYKNIKIKNVIKVDFSFKKSKSFESLIGREAHVQVLENSTLLMMMAYFYKNYFK